MFIQGNDTQVDEGSSTFDRQLENYQEMVESYSKKSVKDIPKKTKSSGVIKVFIRYALLTLFLLATGGSYAVYEIVKVYNSEDTLSKIKVIKQLKPVDNTIIYDTNGEVLMEKYFSYHKYYSYSDIPQDFKNALLSIEDRRFYDHPGIDLKAIIRAGVEVISTGKPKQGGSTITQQVVRHYLLSRNKTIFRKIYEVILSLKLETILSKQEILELYMNNLFLGNGSYGVGAAAERYFGKPLKELTLAEHALIAGLFQAPSRYNPFKRPKLAIKRQRQVLRAMVENQKISLEIAKEAAKEKVTLRNHKNVENSYESFYTDYATEEAKKLLSLSSLKNKGLRIYTTYNKEMNKKAYEAIRAMEPKYTEIENLNNLKESKNQMEAAAVVLDVRTGNIVSMIGGRDYEQSNFNRAYQAKRAPGSSFKPIVYSYALEHGYRWSDVFYVAPVTLAGSYRPKTEKSEYLSESTLLRALFKSMNATTMEIGEKLGLSKITEHAKKMGIESDIKLEFGSLLGQSEVTLVDMARVYSTFANNGKMIQPTTVSKILDRDGKVLYQAPSKEERSTLALSPQINYLMVQGLRKVLSHGTATRARNLSNIAGGKTGTTNNSIDNWFCGFTKDYVTVVWTGPNRPEPLFRGNIQGSTLALPIWKTIMEHSISTNRPKPFPRPSGVTAMRVHPQYGHRTNTGMEMWFLSGSLPQKKASSLEVLEKRGGIMRGFGAH